MNHRSMAPVVPGHIAESDSPQSEVCGDSVEDSALDFERIAAVAVETAERGFVEGDTADYTDEDSPAGAEDQAAVGILAPAASAFEARHLLAGPDLQPWRRSCSVGPS